MSEKTVAEILHESALKTVGKRELLKSFQKLFEKEKQKQRQPIQKQCQARVKGDRTGVKVGRYVLFDNQQCCREAREGELCAIHSNQVKKFGALPLGLMTSPLTEEQKKVFGEL